MRLAGVGISSQSTVTLEAVTSIEGIAALGNCYEHLLAVSGNNLPFALHEWHLAWCRHFLNCDARIHDELLFYVARDSSGTCVGIVPLIISRRRIGPIKVVLVNLLGADPAITEIRTPIVDPRHELIVAHAVQNELAQRDGWDWIHWTGIGAEFARGLSLDASLHNHPPLSDYVLDLAPTWEEFRQGLKRNIRESLRHCYNSLKRDKHDYELNVIEDAGEIKAGLDRFLELHILRAGANTTALHPNRFASQVSRDFLYEVCDSLARRGVVRLFQLKVNSQVVAMRIGFVVGSSLYLYYSGFDPAWARYSVMTTTVAEAIKYAIAQRLKTVNLSPTVHESKTRWGPRQVNYASAFQQGNRLRSRIARQAYVRARSEEGLQAWVLQHLIPARRHWR